MSARTPRLAADKLTFLLALVPYLIDHDNVAVTDVATRFGVNAEEVRSAVRLIAVSGIPGETRQYLHGDLFDIHWDEFEENDRIVLTHQVAIDDSPRFSAREAAALIAGLQYLSALPENADRDGIASLMAKLTRGASAAPSQLRVSSTESSATISVIQAAVQANVQIEFDYLNSRGDRVSRRVDPLRIESVDSDWYLRGWCHLRTAVRTFRLDRISELTVTSEPAGARNGDVPLPDTLFEPSLDDREVVLELPESALTLIADYRPEQVHAAGSADRVRATLRVAHYHALKRLVAGLAGVVTVVSPPEARRVVAEWAAAGAAPYDED
ncbi:DeoR faimly transcriptional regulator [Cryobacterium sp. MLB-32]|uniref:helix-turn-helix transcriptional regulator n=1 Tax=Cryobacterium sp. MLB-32 TaxID=1529318 RepID=UPI0004E65D80|nr:WYL domain-containing protein [Cryobacterium sp. MLB-32]KFF61039.1 DeoR faimly transcriptional regulator [Cryobacterium sp. MLB-32]